MTTTYQIIVQIPVINWPAMLSSLETGLAGAFAILAASYVSLYLLLKIMDIIVNHDFQGGAPVLIIGALLAFASFPAAILGHLLIKAVDGKFVEKQRYDDIKEKAKAYDDYFEVEEE